MKSIDKTSSRVDKYGNWKNEKNNVCMLRTCKIVCTIWIYREKERPINDFSQLTLVIRGVHTQTHTLYVDMHAIRESEEKQEEKGTTIIIIIVKRKYTHTHYTRTHMWDKSPPNESKYSTHHAHTHTRRRTGVQGMEIKMKVKKYSKRVESSSLL